MNNIVLAVLQGRVIRAKMHNRRGPSIMQDYRDLAKLFARPESQSEDASFALRIMPPLFFAVAFMLAMGLPLFTAQSPIPVFGDAITIMYSLALARFFFALCGVDSSNAYAGIGGVRELLMSVLIEPSMLLALFAAALVCGSTDIATMGQHIMTGAIDAPVAVILAGIAFAIACYMELGKLPFDQAEAEQELQEGPLAELSGPSLAMAKLAMSMKQVLVVAWFCAIFVPWGEPAAVGIAAVLGAVIFLVKCLIDFVVCGVIENSCSRSRGRRRVGEGRNNVICSQSVPSRLGRYCGPDGGLGARRPVPPSVRQVVQRFGCRRLDGLHRRPRREFRWRRHARHAGPPDLVWADPRHGIHLRSHEHTARARLCGYRPACRDLFDSLYERE